MVRKRRDQADEQARLVGWQESCWRCQPQPQAQHGEQGGSLADEPQFHHTDCHDLPLLSFFSPLSLWRKKEGLGGEAHEAGRRESPKLDGDNEEVEENGNRKRTKRHDVGRRTGNDERTRENEAPAEITLNKGGNSNDGLMERIRQILRTVQPVATGERKRRGVKAGGVR